MKCHNIHKRLVNKNYATSLIIIHYILRGLTIADEQQIKLSKPVYVISPCASTENKISLNT